MPGTAKPQDVSGHRLNRQNIRKNLILLLTLSAVVRAILATTCELGNDEVYYWTYALYPDLSHFDHPPMVGWLIRIFTFNLHFQEEFFIRLASIIIGTLNAWLIFLLGRKLKDELTGWYAALLYTSSIYGFAITGIFILPDTPQIFFWLLALISMIDVLPINRPDQQAKWKMILVGIFLGLGMLSKYSTVFLWVGMVSYIIFFNRNWFRQASFYFAHLLILAFFSLVLIWNFKNGFVSFAYQGGRGMVSDIFFNYNTFLSEIGGEFLYQNPVIFVLIPVAIISLLANPETGKDTGVRMLLFCGVPLILVFWVISLFRSTLPHWTGPGFITLIPLAALWLRLRHHTLIPSILAVSLSLLILIVGLSALQIRTGFLGFEEPDTKSHTGIKDFSLEVYGWSQLGNQFRKISTKYENAGEIQSGAPMVTYRWFPAANLEYYAAKPSGRYVLAAGSLDAIHKYAWINRIHGGFRMNTDAWYITSSIDFKGPEELQGVYYRVISSPDTVPVYRNGQLAYRFFLYRLTDLQAKPPDPFTKH